MKYFRILTDRCDDHKSPFTVGNLDGTMSALSLVSVPGKHKKQKTKQKPELCSKTLKHNLEARYELIVPRTRRSEPKKLKF